LVPVIATIGAGENQLATSTSLNTGFPSASASRTMGASDGTPGLSTTTSASRTRHEFSPNSYGIPRASSSPCAAFILSAGALSLRNTLAPCALSSAATASPLLAPPRTLKTFPLISCWRNEVYLTLNVARLRIIKRTAAM
jgi:hypothetical protein